MNELNRRDFLKLSGTAAVLAALAGCGSAPSTPRTLRCKGAGGGAGDQQGLGRTVP